MTYKVKISNFFSTLLIVVFILSLISVGELYGQPNNKPTNEIGVDSTKVEQLHFQEEQLADFLNDSDFKYSEVLAPTGPSFWQRLKYWFLSLLLRIFSFGGELSVGKIITYVVCIAVIAFVVLQLMGVKVSKLFYGTGKGNFLNETIGEDVHEMDFDTLLANAKKNGDFRLAVRLTYLHTLKKLSEKQLIHFKIGKTNQDYCNELKNNHVKDDFELLGYYFQHAWYGHFKVDEQIFERSKNFFDKINNAI